MRAPGVVELPAVLADLGPAKVERRATFDASPESPGLARRLVDQALAEASRTDWADSAELAVSEVVTNATLHAHTPVDVWVGVFDDQLCVEVRDFSPMLPTQRDYDLQATTGRGMGLVAALARSCGVHSLGDGGKVVWFCVTEASPPVTADLSAAWDIDELLDSAMAAPALTEIVLHCMPAMLWLSARQHQDALIRELVLYLAEHAGLEADIPAADLARGRISTALLEAVEAARREGTAVSALPFGHPSPLPDVPRDINLRVRVPVEAASQFATLQDVLDLAEQLAVDGELLIRPGLPEIVAVRDWVCEQVVTQLAGHPARAWPGTDQERFERDVNDRSVPAIADWNATLVTESDRGAIAADDANRIVAVSRPLAAWLGWHADELVGRRVVTVIPPALREAHVAGFSRHLTTGEAHVLGVPLDLPVLCKDGRQIMCRFLVERAPASGGRAVYLAWIEPIAGGDPGVG